MHPEYNMVATEIDPDAIQLARQNMRDNGLKKRVTVVPVQSPEAVLLSAVPDLPRATAEVGEPAKPRYDFVVCNPPFLGLDQAPANRTGRRPAPHRATATPAPSEQRVEGGEVAFAMQMIADSVALQRHIHWFTSMVGAKASLKPLVAHLKEIVGINCILTGSLIQVMGRWDRWGSLGCYISLGGAALYYFYNRDGHTGGW